MSKDFCHLHTHTEYSLLDGIIKIKELCDRIKKLNMTACAITDHGSMGGVIEFYKATTKAGIKPIIGVEAYITEDKDDIENRNKIKDNHHLILLAQDEVGFSNIIKLLNQAYIHNFYYKPRISIQNLYNNTTGIIATSACLGGVIAKLGSFNIEDESFIDSNNSCRLKLELYTSLFKDRFYAEIQDIPKLRFQTAYNKWLIQQAKELNIPLVITSDAHFLTEEDYDTHRLVIAKNMGKVLESSSEDDDGLVFHKEHCIRTPEQMYESACKFGIEEAYWNTLQVAERCNLKIKLGEYKYPQFDISTQPDYEDFLLWKQSKK